jgi:hypothetical protein
MKTALLFTLASCCDSPTLDLNGMDGLNFSSCCLIIIVSIPVLLCFVANLTRESVVMTKPKEKDGVTKYNVNRRVSGVNHGVVQISYCWVI